jgi:hypothetical protein
VFFVCASACASVFGGRLCACQAFCRVFSPHFVDLLSNVSERALSYNLLFCPAFSLFIFGVFLCVFVGVFVLCSRFSVERFVVLEGFWFSSGNLS